MKKNLVAILGAALVVLSAGTAPGQDQINLLRNGDLVTGEEGAAPPGWTFSTWNLPNDGTESAKVEYGLFTDSEGIRCLRISSKRNEQTFVWWQQEISAHGGASYVLRFKAKSSKGEGGPKSFAGMAATFYFTDSQGKYMGAEKLLGIGVFSGADTGGGTIVPSDTWEKYEARMTIPDEAVKLGVRLSLQGNMEAEAFFTEIELTVE